MAAKTLEPEKHTPFAPSPWPRHPSLSSKNLWLYNEHLLHFQTNIHHHTQQPPIKPPEQHTHTTKTQAADTQPPHGRRNSTSSLHPLIPHHSNPFLVNATRNPVTDTEQMKIYGSITTRIIPPHKTTHALSNNHPSQTRQLPINHQTNKSPQPKRNTTKTQHNPPTPPVRETTLLSPSPPLSVIAKPLPNDASNKEIPITDTGTNLPENLTP